MDPLPRLRAGVEQARPVIAATPKSDYGRPTPCAGWTVQDVINHMIGALTMFRDVAVDGVADPALFGRDLIAGDAAASFDQTAEEALSAWSEPGKIDGTAKLPFGEFPATFALQLPAMDMVVHSWDVAKATGRPVEWNAELVHDTLAFSEATFTSAEFRGDSFAPPVTPPPNADELTRLVCFLGRQPA
jgi:uncharacterized protein (TIGR03086 family)